jgi:hypothetical protein
MNLSLPFLVLVILAMKKRFEAAILFWVRMIEEEI